MMYSASMTSPKKCWNAYLDCGFNGDILFLGKNYDTTKLQSSNMAQSLVVLVEVLSQPNKLLTQILYLKYWIVIK